MSKTIEPLRDIQKEALAYAIRTKHPAIFLEQRLGKCRVVLYRLLMTGGSALVVCPSSAVLGWIDECKALDISYVVLEGTPKQRDEILYWFEAMAMVSDIPWVLITIYQTAMATPKVSCMLRKWSHVVLDESTSIKNYQSSTRPLTTHFFLKNFRDAEHRWCLAGEPAPESALEYWPQLAWLDGHAFGYTDFWAFRCYEFYQNGFDWHPKPTFKPKLLNVLSKRCFMRTQKEAGYNVKSSRSTVEVRHSTAWMDTYRKTEKSFDFGTKETVWATVRYTWLRYIAAGLDPVTKELSSTRKITALNRILSDGVPSIVVFAFNDELLHAIEAAPKKAGKCSGILGEVKKETRRYVVSQFGAGKINNLYCQTKCINMGMNLSRARRMIFFSVDPGHLNFLQVCQRTVDLGRQSDPIEYIFLKVRGTVDEDIMDAMTVKGWTTQQIRTELANRVRSRQRAKFIR